MSLRPRLCAVLVLICSFLLLSIDANAFPAFARKYGLRCSACHVAWPILNDFGWRFKDNGYQLMNDRDAPIWQNPSYWPVSFRMTPNWHRESTDRVQEDTAAGPGTGEVQISSNGFDNSGLDILAGGTLYKNISFLLVPSADETGAFHFESVWTRVDNLFKTPWVNIKFGKLELDNWISEKRIPSLSKTGGFYQNYHFEPIGDNNFVAHLGDNQLGIEWMGHSVNDHTRVSAALFSSNDGNPDLVNANAYSGYFSASQGLMSEASVCNVSADTTSSVRRPRIHLPTITPRSKDPAWATRASIGLASLVTFTSAGLRFPCTTSTAQIASIGGRQLRPTAFCHSEHKIRSGMDSSLSLDSSSIHSCCSSSAASS